MTYPNVRITIDGEMQKGFDEIEKLGYYNGLKKTQILRVALLKLVSDLKKDRSPSTQSITYPPYNPKNFAILRDRVKQRMKGKNAHMHYSQEEIDAASY